MPIISCFQGGGSSSGSGSAPAGKLPIGAVINVSVVIAPASVYVKWTDPEDIVNADGTPTIWDGTRLLRKQGSVPENHTDGIMVLDSKARNQYEEFYFCDTGLENGTTYYYKFFPYSRDGVFTNSEACEFTATPSTTAEVKPLEEYTWSDIDAITQLGMAPDYFDIGDMKSVEIDLSNPIGSIDYTSLPTVPHLKLYARIIGFNHNGLNETPSVDFELSGMSHYQYSYEDEVTDFTVSDVCLTDSYYNTALVPRLAFSMNHYTSYSYGGWRGCDLRYDILGSTDVPPNGWSSHTYSSGRMGYDATETCATNPVPNTLMAALEYDLRAHMKPMEVWADGVGNASSAAGNVVKSIDYLPLLAIFEILGKTTNGNPNESSYQKQYDFYVLGNGKIRYDCFIESPSKRIWWTRTAANNYSGKYVVVNASGSSTYVDTHMSQGLVPIFRI